MGRPLLRGIGVGWSWHNERLRITNLLQSARCLSLRAVLHGCVVSVHFARECEYDYTIASILPDNMLPKLCTLLSILDPSCAPCRTLTCLPFLRLEEVWARPSQVPRVLIASEIPSSYKVGCDQKHEEMAFKFRKSIY